MQWLEDDFLKYLEKVVNIYRGREKQHATKWHSSLLFTRLCRRKVYGTTFIFPVRVFIELTRHVLSIPDAHHYPNIHKFMKNTQALGVIQQRTKTVKGKCKGNRDQT